MAGDMFLGACLDLGLPEAILAETLSRLGLPGVGIEIRRASRGGVVGTRFRVLQDGQPVEGPDPEEAGESGGYSHGHAQDEGQSHPHEPSDSRQGHTHAHHGHAHGRNLLEIRHLVARSDLDVAVKERALQLFARLGEAEARVHGVPIEQVHFHEVGAVDAIVDLVGAAAAIHHLAPERLTCGPVNVGGGTVGTAHGRLPVPAPATALLLAGMPVYGSPHGELLTPTGAVLLAELVDEFTELPPLAIEAVGYGLGKRQLADRPNAVRLMRGRSGEGTGAVMVLECEIDHLPGEAFGFLLERLLENGALDAFFTPVQMKKSRPGTLVTVLCRRERLEALASLLLAESGSLGCRYHAVARFEAERREEVVETPWGAVRVKRGTFAGRPLSVSPEYEDCRRIALERGVPWREGWRAALAAASGERG